MPFVCQSMHGEGDKVPVHSPRFANHFHGLTTRFDIFSYNRVRSPDDSLQCVYAFILCLTLLAAAAESYLHGPSSSSFYSAQTAVGCAKNVKYRKERETAAGTESVSIKFYAYNNL